MIEIDFCGSMIPCRYGATLTATVSSSANTLAINQVVARQPGSAVICPAVETLITTMTPLYADVDGSNTYNAGDYLVQLRA